MNTRSRHVDVTIKTTKYTNETRVQAYIASPFRSDTLLLLGAVHYQLKQYDACIAYNDRAILLDPTMAEAHVNLGNALQQVGSLDMAIVYYQVRTR